MGRRLLGLAAAISVLALLACVLAMIYYISDADCRGRGGHTEAVYGGRGGGWTCTGASRP